MKEIKFYDTRDIYRIVRGSSLRGLGIKEKEFCSIVNAINEKIANTILCGELVKLPCSMGTIIPMEQKAMYVNKHGKLVINRPTDWKTTIKLWEEDSQAKADNVRIKHDVDKRFKIIYSKKEAKFRNQYYIRFKPIKSLREKFINRAVDGEISCYTD